MARPECYIVGYDLSAYAELKNKGLSPEGILKTRLNEQIPAYLGEFILGVRFKKFFYEEAFNPQTGQKELQAPGFIGEIGKSYDKAIGETKARGWSGAREEAECEGFKKLEKQLFQAPCGTFYLWISPPGSKEEGYGDYSFTHLGQIQKSTNGRRIEVASIRNNLTLEEQAQIINHFLPAEEKLENPKDTDFLRSPVVVENKNDSTSQDLLVTIDVILKRTGGRVTHFGQAYQEREEWEKKLLQLLQPMIDDYYRLLEEGASKGELQRTIWAIENYTKEMITGENTTFVNEGPVLTSELAKTVFYERWSYEPVALAGGSCPPNRINSAKGSFSSAVLPWQEHKLENSHSSEEKRTLDCECPNCHKQVEAIIENGKIHCPACGASAEYNC